MFKNNIFKRPLEWGKAVGQIKRNIILTVLNICAGISLLLTNFLLSGILRNIIITVITVIFIIELPTYYLRAIKFLSKEINKKEK